MYRLVTLSILLAGLLAAAAPARADSLPAVSYDDATGEITIGADYGQAPFAGFPARPDAPKSALSIPQLAAALAAIGRAGLLADQGGGAWLLGADVVVRQDARLEVTSADLSALRLDSTPGRRPVRIVARGGALRIAGVRVTSWDTSAGAVDGDYHDGRSYLLAELGGRMDIVDSEVAYLGWSPGEPSGIAYRKRATDSDPQTGATGSIIRSDIHHNYFGQYSYEAYGLQVLHSRIHDNVYYGLDPHDYSQGFEFAYNQVYSNGKHGIIFSRGCTNNRIHDNEVYNNAQHGIMLDRGSDDNIIANNLVYDNRDGVAIFQSSGNVVRDNVLRDNQRGVRINATYDPGDSYDGVAADNIVRGNTITHNTQYGVYLYERADRNQIVGNTISFNADSGVYIKTGGNLVDQNQITANGHGVTVIGGAAAPIPPGGPPPALAAGSPGLENTITANTIEDNAGAGVQVKGGVATRIGPADPQASPAQGNLIRANGQDGVRLSDSATGSYIAANTIEANGRAGVRVQGAGSQANQISRNSIAANGDGGIALADGANAGVPAPTISSAAGAATVTGTAAPGATVEIYRDQRGQGRVFKGATSADGAGIWSFALPPGDNPAGEGFISALASTADGNSSAFVTNATIPVAPSYEVSAGRNGELTVYVSGEGATVDLPTIQTALKTISPTVQLLDDQGGGVWQLNASLFIRRGVTLNLTAESGLSWLKLRSQADPIALAALDLTPRDYQSFVGLITYDGVINIDGVKVTSWDPAANDYDRDISNGRSYLLAKYDARMDIHRAELAYLGSADGESYGVSWRDIDDPDVPDVRRTRVTGSVTDSDIHDNYYGIYTFQARDMVFRGNKFHHNIGYGFDPHDYSHDFVVENNDSFANGNHGFIISRGCTGFVFRNNRAYDNHYTVDARDHNAHGFMLDPGSPNSQYPQVPSANNLLENNQAWGNDGYGLRMIGAISNTIRLNVFRDNQQGVTLEQQSTGNTITGNTITGNTLYGIYVNGGSDGNALTDNSVSKNGVHGIYIKTGDNQIIGNQLSGNGTMTSAGPDGSGLAFLLDTAAGAQADLVPPGATASLAASDPELLSRVDLASALSGNLVRDNQISANVEHGIELKGASDTTIDHNVLSANGVHGVYLSSYQGVGATGTRIEANTISGNGGQGIRANNPETLGNVWSQNHITSNIDGGIWTTDGANGDPAPPTITLRTAALVEGTAQPGATVEVFADPGEQGYFYEGTATADATGVFRLERPAGWDAANLTAIATVAGAGSSAFSAAVAEGEAPPIYSQFLPLVAR